MTRDEDARRGGPEGDLLDLAGPAVRRPQETLFDLEALRRGESQAFDRLWNRYRPALEILVAAKIRSGLDPVLGSRLDAEQEVAIRTLAKFQEFEYRGPGSVLSWMSAIAAFVVQERVQYWTAEKRNPHLERPLPSPGSADSSVKFRPRPPLRHPGVGPSTAFDLADRRRRIGAALAGLPERHHKIVFLRFFGGADWEEIAREVGAPSADAVRMECYLKVFPRLSTLLTRPSGDDSPATEGGTASLL
jgi:DNA-directed RNA polymerase specialized sigma24 family protein